MNEVDIKQKTKKERLKKKKKTCHSVVNKAIEILKLLSFMFLF